MRAGRMAKVVEHQPCKQALSSNPQYWGGGNNNKKKPRMSHTCRVLREKYSRQRNSKFKGPEFIYD
jgi:hypothetical protein